MADYSDITLGAEWQEIDAEAEDVIIHADGGPLRFTSHTAPAGATRGIRLDSGTSHVVKAGTAIMARSDCRVPVTLIRVTA